MKGKIISISIAVVLLITIVVCGRVFIVRTIEERYAVSPENTLSGAVISVSHIDLNESILGLNETRITNLIEGKYADRRIKVTNIERVFPNKVVIYVKERTPICAIAKVNTQELALADIDFQLNKLIDTKEIDYSKIIKVEGIKVDLSFNNAQFAVLRNILLAFTETGIPDYALPQLICKITISEQLATVDFRDNTKISAANDNNIKTSIKNQISK